jgi:fatty-acyl-CoA synthase
MRGLMMDYPLTIDRILEHANRMYPHKRISTRLPDSSMHRYTYADLYKRVKRLCNVLVGLGVQPGDRVATFAWNNYQHLELYYAVPCAGAVCHTLNIRLSLEQLAYVTNHAEDSVVFVDATLLSHFEEVYDLIGGDGKFVVFNAEGAVETRLPNVLYYEDLVSQADDDFEWEVTDENTAAGLCYTSGTTGDPKGVLYSHRSIYLHTMAENQANALGLSERDVVLPVVPQFHSMAWGLPYSAAFAGAELVLPGSERDTASILDLIVRERVTVPVGVPTVWDGLFRELKRKHRNLSQVRCLVACGAAMPRALIARFEQEYGVEVMHAWGMTETSPLGTVSRLSSHHDELSEHEKLDFKATQGQAVPGVEIRIVNDEGDRLHWDGSTMGEVQVCGPWITKGYFKEKPGKERFTKDGWFRTGDVATVTKDGYMQITDRTKDLVRSGGEWISSVALENELMTHPKVQEAAVIAIRDERWGERPLAVVVLVPEAGRVTREEFSIHLVEHFPEFWLPDDFVLVEEIPKTSVGKFDKKLLRQRHVAGELGA